MKFEKLRETIIASTLWRSIFRGGTWKPTERDRAQHIVGNVFLHLHPPLVRSHALRFSYTWGLGGISFLLFLILAVTGIFLMFVYVPEVNRAYTDMQDLKYVVPFGRLMRNLHRWAAHAMVITVWVHMLLVFLRAGYKKPREFNWIIGIVLLVFTMLFSFTGYLLPWDQLAYWAVTVGTNMAGATPFLGAEGPLSFMDYGNDIRFALLGGKIIGQNALIRFYSFHCLAIVFVACIFLCIHFWRVRKDRFSGPPEASIASGGPPDKLATWPHLVKREFLTAIVVMVVLLLWSLLADAPLEEPANPTLTPNPAKAPWYFLGLQELLVYFDPWIAGVVIPGLITFGLMAIPYLDTNPKGVGEFSLRQKPLATTLFLSGFGMWILLIIIGEFFRGPGWVWYWPWEDWEIPKSIYEKTWSFPGYIGGPLLVGYFVGGALFLYRRFARARTLGPGRASLFIFLLLAMIGLVVKIFLRLFFNIHYVLVTPWFNI